MEMPRWNNTAWLKRINFIGHAPQRHVNKHPQSARRHRWLPNPPNLGWGVAKSYFFSVPTLLSINIWLFLGDFRLFSNPNLVAMETISRSAHLLENRTRALERHNPKGSDFSESTAQIPLIQRCLPALWQSQELVLRSGPRIVLQGHGSRPNSMCCTGADTSARTSPLGLPWGRGGSKHSQE